ncbi:TrbI/VirB10 family protein [Brevundimonas nasdae]|uniref:TrbI/VirB10 family protein n=1 Tax=Brevundimonas nasdae TaxID=172043 RepID=UPI003F691BBE
MALPTRGLPVWLLVSLAALAALLLFFVLDGRRRATSAPVTSGTAQAAAFPSPPPLILPNRWIDGSTDIESIPEDIDTSVSIPEADAPLESASIVLGPPVFSQLPAPRPPDVAPGSAGWSLPPPPLKGSNILVVDAGVPVSRTRQGSPAGASSEVPTGASEKRAASTGRLNQATTVAQGTIIAAVLETAIDTTADGFVRAVVSHDIRAFDGAAVLIPRGSRLVGEVGADTRLGQKRVLITWVRLIRPDGVTMDIAAPATDGRGRIGAAARVDTHFWDRFSGAILRSALDVGVNLAAREANTPMIIALPGSISSGPAQPAAAITPTLTVRAGQAVSVFVANDLDFSGSREGR